MRGRFINVMGTSAIAILALSHGAAFAEAAPQPAAPQLAGQSSADPTATTGEIIVTAQKRSQKLNDVGITIVAATSAQLQTAGVTEVSQLAKIAPGFSVGQNYQGYSVYSLRGVNFIASQFSAPPAVSTYIDEAILPYSPMTSGLLLDVDHVEVLKGPQGTLFGQNATGGSINVVAAKPTRVFSAGFHTEVNNFGGVIAGGYISGPLSETLRVRLAAETTQFGAWQRGYYLFHGTNGDQNKGAVRLLADWAPTDKLTINLNVNANYDHGQALQYQLAQVAPVSPAAAAPGLIGYPVATNARDVEVPPGLDTHKHNRLYQGVLRVAYEFSDAATLTSLTNYIDYKSLQPQSITGVAIPLQNSISTGDDQTFSQELRLTGKLLDGKLHYVLGGNYSHDKVYDEQYLIAIAYSGLPANTLLDTQYHPTNDQKAVFGNVDYEIVPKLTFTGGVRYTSIKETTSGCTLGNAQAAGILGFLGNLDRGIAGLPANYAAYVPGGCVTINDNVANVQNPNGPGLIPDYLPIGNPYVSQKEHNVSWRAGLDYKVAPNSLVYGIVSRGYKAGMFPVQPDVTHSGFVPVKQEELTSYELGVKLDLLDHAVRFNGSGFYYDYVNKQFFTYIPAQLVGVTSTVVNIPKSSVKGVEFDATVTPIQALTIRAAATYIKTRIGQFTTINSSGQSQNITGSEFNYASPFSANADVEYRFPVGNDLHAYIGGDGQYDARTFGNLGEPANQVIPHYLVLDARVGVESDKGWRFGLFVRNLADKYYYTAVFYAGDTLVHVPGAPRTFGATAGFKF